MADAALTLRRVYAEICKGYSAALWKGEMTYVKHLAHYDYVDIDMYYEEAYRRARARGIKTRAERLKWMEDKGLWKRGDDASLAMQRSYVENLEKTKSKQFLRAQIDQLSAQLTEARAKLSEDTQRKESLIGLTCERVADQRVQFHYIYLACFRDAALTERRFTLDQMAQLDDEDSNDLIYFYIDLINRLDIEAIKRVSLAPYFTSHFYLCADAPYHFFSKPICDLSSYQVHLLSYGASFKRLLEENKVPDDLRTDPDKLIEFVNKSQNFKAAVAKTSGAGGRVGIVGATQGDFDALGIENSTNVMHEAANKGYKSGIEAAKEMGVTWIDP